MSYSGADLLFLQCVAGACSGSSGHRREGMTLEQFQLALTLVSQRKYQPDPGEVGCAAGLIRLFEEHLFPLAHFVAPQENTI